MATLFFFFFLFIAAIFHMLICQLMMPMLHVAIADVVAAA